MRKLATITFIGKDKTGLIARVTAYIFATRGNIEEMEQHVKRGQFSMILQVSWDGSELNEQILAKELLQLGKELGLEAKIRFHHETRLQKAALFVTREAHVLKAVLDGIRAKTIKCSPAVIIGNRPDLKPIAKEAQIPFVHIPFEDRSAAEKKTVEYLDELEVDFIVLARFMKILSPNFVWHFPNKILNIHPSLLPSFPGANAYRQAYEKGVKVVGVTAHFVTMDLDQGPIITQDSFKVKPNEPLSSIIKRGQDLESRTLVKAMQLYLQNRLDVHWGQVHLV